ncbi:DUF4395 domain-containing protein [Bacteroidota bacterium]
MTQVCPIVNTQINEKVTRLNALISFLIVTLFVFTPYKYIILFLMLDFALRSFNDGKYSPIKGSNQFLANALGLKHSLINAGPKIFAARIGLLLSFVITISFLMNYEILANIVAGILGFFSFLEAFFGFCVACKIYPFVAGKF